MKNPTSFIWSIFAFSVCLALPPVAAQAGAVAEAGQDNTIASPQNIDQDFGAGGNDDIENSTNWPWVSISATGDGTFDYYSFEVPAAGDVGVFDIDYGYGGAGGFDTKLCLYTSDGALIDSGDDSSPFDGADGSNYNEDAYIYHTFAAAGTYVIGVGKFYSACNDGGISGSPPGETDGVPDTYVLQVSLSQHADPVVDTDGDGVADDADCNPFSDLNPTVTFESCDSGVANTRYENGCTLADRIFACAEGADGHGAFTSCVAAVTNDLKKAGEITGSDKVMIQSCAAQSAVAK